METRHATLHLQSVTFKHLRRTPICRSASPQASLQPFHLAFPVSSIQASKDFYGTKLGCVEGRSAPAWVDYSLFGHQIVCHEVKGYSAASIHNAVDGDPVPVPHFGLALTTKQFHTLAKQVESSGVEFVLKPHLRFKGQPGEQWTMFFKDPSGNALEFKAMTNPENLFAKYSVS
jgi:extradiol dioxygenase family protein